MEEISRGGFAVARDDITRQVQAMLHARFLTETPWWWLQQVPRFLEAITMRIEKLTGGDKSKDEANVGALQPYLVRLEEIEKPPSGNAVEALEEYRWMLEEFRVSLFAQKLGTSIKVSTQRLDKQWKKVLDAG